MCAPRSRTDFLCAFLAFNATTRAQSLDTMKFFVRTLTGRTHELNLDPATTIDELCIKVYEIDGIPPEHQQLVFAGRRLLDGTLSDYGMQHECTIHMVIGGCMGGRSLIVKPPTGKRFVQGTYRGPVKIAEVIGDVAKTLGVPPGSIGIALKGVTLNPRHTLEDVGLQNNSQVDVVTPYVPSAEDLEADEIAAWEAGEGAAAASDTAGSSTS